MERYHKDIMEKVKPMLTTLGVSEVPPSGGAITESAPLPTEVQSSLMSDKKVVAIVEAPGNLLLMDNGEYQKLNIVNGSDLSVIETVEHDNMGGLCCGSQSSTDKDIVYLAFMALTRFNIKTRKFEDKKLKCPFMVIAM